MYYDLELFGKAICKIRNTLGYTQKDISELTTITTETLRKIENGKVVPTHITLELLSSALKEDLNLLLLNFRISNYKIYYEIEDRIERNLGNGNYADLEKDLDILNNILDKRDLSNYMCNLIQQLRLLVESIILKINNKDYINSLNKLIDSMKVTTPLFELNKYNEFVYSSLEMRILMNISLLTNILGTTDECLEILLFCLNSLDPEEIDFKLRIYYNLAYTYHRKDLHGKALFYANCGIKACIENNSLNYLGLLYSRKFIAEYFLEDDNFKVSLGNAINIYDITDQRSLKDMIIKFCNKHNIEII